MRKFKYGVLAVLFVLWTFSISYEFISPWSVFGQYVSYKGWSDLSGWLTVGGQFLIAAMLFSLVVERGFCRYFCPLGGVFSLISRGRLFRVKNNGHCAGCGKCDSECPMGVNVSAESGSRVIPGGSVTSPECIDCFRCVDRCGANALYTSPREAVAGSAAAIAIAGVYKIGAITVNSPISGVTPLTSASQTRYADGTYEGSAQGYRGEVKVSVSVSGGVITSVTVESYRDDDEFFNRAKDTVISEILSAQTADVQTVSGATYSSRGIIQAVANALGVTVQQTQQEQSGETRGRHGTEQNGGERRKPGSSDNGGEGKSRKGRPGGSYSSSDNGNNGSQSKPEPNQNLNQNVNLDFTDLKDGTYTGKGQGRNGAVEVTVKVKKGKVTSVTVESSSEDAQYMNRAKDAVISEIIDSQSLNVDTVSGATMSSNGIIDAVADALGIEYTNPNSQRGAKGQRRSR